MTSDKSRLKNIAKYVGICVVLAAVTGAVTWFELGDSGKPAEAKTALRTQFESDPKPWLAQAKDYSDFEAYVRANQIKEVGVAGIPNSPVPLLLVTTRKGERYNVLPVTKSDSLETRLESASQKNGFALTRISLDTRTPREKATESALAGAGVAAKVLTMALSVFVILFMLRMMGPQRAKSKLSKKPETRFSDVIGASEAKSSMQELVAFMRSPEKYAALGARPPRGVLLEGPPGTGKTLLARALAGECGANFIAVDGSYFSSMFYEQGIKRVAGLFKTARENAPCVIFIDEFDGIGARSASVASTNGQGEENRIINKLLVEMDGFKPTDNVVVVGATNHLSNIDKALCRPGRFDSLCTMTLPNIDERAQLFSYYLAKVKAHDSIAATELAKTSAGSSPADIALIVNRAAILAAEDGAPLVTQDHLQQALESHQLGGRVSNVKSLITPEARERIAFHESGHALVGYLSGAGSIGRISIEPRGQALGATFFSRDDETPLYGEQELHARLNMLLAGREAELLVYSNTTSGAADDLKKASELAMKMVSELGFSPEFGVLSLSGVPAELVSQNTKEKALDAARRLLESAQSNCQQILARYRSVLDSLAAALLEHENVSGTLLKDLLASDSRPAEGGGWKPALA
jgi:cell division protease FtsH